jgi:hypothetical protein
MTVRAELKEALDEVCLHVLERLTGEAEMACGDDKGLLHVMKAEAKLLFACRNVTNAVSESPFDERPKDWDVSWDGDTA